jgi:hypothetical protein
MTKSKWVKKCGSSCRAPALWGPALQAQSPEFKPHSHKHTEKFFLYRGYLRLYELLSGTKKLWHIDWQLRTDMGQNSVILDQTYGYSIRRCMSTNCLLGIPRIWQLNTSQSNVVVTCCLNMKLFLSCLLIPPLPTDPSLVGIYHLASRQRLIKLSNFFSFFFFFWQ